MSEDTGIVLSISAAQDTPQEVKGTIYITREPPSDFGEGVNVYLFDNGKLTGMDIVIPPYDRSLPVTSAERVRSHSNLSPLDHVCVDAIINHYGEAQYLPPEVFCRVDTLACTAHKVIDMPEIESSDKDEDNESE